MNKKQNGAQDVKNGKEKEEEKFGRLSKERDSLKEKKRRREKKEDIEGERKISGSSKRLTL